MPKITQNKHFFKKNIRPDTIPYHIVWYNITIWDLRLSYIICCSIILYHYILYSIIGCSIVFYIIVMINIVSYNPVGNAHTIINLIFIIWYAIFCQNSIHDYPRFLTMIFIQYDQGGPIIVMPHLGELCCLWLPMFDV